MAPTDERRAIAFHEAGHFVADRARGAVPGPLTIEPKGTALGSCSGEEGLRMVPQPDGSFRVRNADIRALIVSLYAGHAAEVRFDPSRRRVARAGARDDDARARRYLRWLRKRGTAAACRRQAARLVDAHWPAVTAVAELLLDRGWVDGEEADVVADVAEGNATLADLGRLRARHQAAMRSSG